MNDFVQEQWAQDAVAAIDCAIAQHNQADAESNPIRIAWGSSHPTKADHRFQEGLLNWDGMDIEVLIGRHDDGNHYVGVNLFAKFSQDVTVPRSLKKLYNLLASLEPGVTLSIVPDKEAREIVVCGVETRLAGDNLNARILEYSLDRLVVSARAAYSLLTGGGFEDYWKKDGL